MSIYHKTIRFKDKTNEDFDLIVSHFSDNADNGETDIYQDLAPIFVDKYDGTSSTDFGARFTQKAQPTVTLINKNGEDIHPGKVRQILQWLTGVRNVSWLDLCNENGKVLGSYLGRFTSAKEYKMDSRVIGIVAYFTATGPFAYSGVKTKTFDIDGSHNTFKIINRSDDLYTSVYPDVVFTNAVKDAIFTLYNSNAQAETSFDNLQQGEVITINNNFIVYSDNKSRIFGEDFNFVFPELVPGDNDFVASGKGTLTISYRYPIKSLETTFADYAIYVEGITLVFDTDGVYVNDHELVITDDIDTRVVGEVLIIE